MSSAVRLWWTTSTRTNRATDLVIVASGTATAAVATVSELARTSPLSGGGAVRLAALATLVCAVSLYAYLRSKEIRVLAVPGVLSAGGSGENSITLHPYSARGSDADFDRLVRAEARLSKRSQFDAQWCNTWR